MTRPAVPPLWRAAPFRLLRTPGWLGLLLVAATLLVASVVAPPLFVDTARATALTDGLTATAGNPYGKESGDLRVTWDAPLSNRAEAAVLDRLAAIPAYGEPTLTASGTAQSLSKHGVAVAGDRQAPAVVWYRDGAVEALGGEPVTDGVWLTSATARELGLEVGDPFRLGTVDTFFGDKPALVPVVLAGTFDAAAGSTLPQAVADQPDSDRLFVPFDPQEPSVPAPIAVVDKATFDRVAPRIDADPLYVADLRLDPDVTPDEAHAAVAAVDAFNDDAFDGGSDLYGDFATGRPEGAAPSVITGLPVIVEAADRTADSAREQVRPYAVGGEVLAVVLLVAAWVLLGLSRRREQLLATGLGLRPVELAGLAALEVLLACVLAVPAGLALAHLGVAVAGPGSAEPIALTAAQVQRAAVAAGLALVLLAAAAGVAGFTTDRLDRVSRLGGARTAVPWGSALLAATAVVTVAVLTVDVGKRSSTPLTTVFPFLVAASVALLVLRGLGWLRARRRTRARPGTPRWLAARRSGPVVREVYALAGVVAVALGLFAYTLSVQRGIDEGVADKTAALTGSASSIEVAEDLRGHGTDPEGTDRAVTPPVPDSTVVWSRGVSVPPVFGEVPVLAIDPDTFADVADWGGSGELDAGRDLVPDLARPAKGLPVILAGDTDLVAGDQAVLSFTAGSTVPVSVLGVVPAFPGSERETGTMTVVIDSRRLFKVLGRTPPVVDPRVRGATSDDAGAFTSTVWSSRPVADLRSQLTDARFETSGAVTTAAQARIDAGLVASTWAAGYVLALGAVALALALAAGLVLVLRLADRDTVSDVLLRRMGYAAGDLARARAWEVGYAVAAGVLAATVAVAVLVLGPSTIDAAAGVPPLTRPRAGLADAVALLAVLALLVLAAWLLGTVLARRRSAAEVLRAGD
ncbi:hypothetical protein [Nocardioides sp.]|uniref:hypothetical protein n=1 Tax=Nocardioides sp. TaxID=35761 RepID=UPI003784763E